MLIVHPPAGLTEATTLPRAPGLRWLLQLQVLGSCWYICTRNNTSEGTMVGKKSQEKMAKKIIVRCHYGMRRQRSLSPVWLLYENRATRVIPAASALFCSLAMNFPQHHGVPARGCSWLCRGARSSELLLQGGLWVKRRSSPQSTADTDSTA